MADELNYDEFETGEPISETMGLRYINVRLPWSDAMRSSLRTQGSSAQPQMRAQIAKLVFEMIPEEYRTKEFLQQADIRPYLQKAMMAGAQNSETGETEIDGAVWTDQQRHLAGQILIQLNRDYEKTVYENLKAEIPYAPGSGEYIEAEAQAKATAANITNQYREGTIIRAPERIERGEQGGLIVDPSTGQVRTTEGASSTTTDFAAALGATLNGTDSRTPSRFITQQEIEDMVRIGDIDFEGARQLSNWGGQETDPITGEATRTEANAKVLYSDDMRTNSMRPVKGRPSTYKSKDWYSLNDIKRKPGEMSREELMVIHERLKKAGLYDMVGGEPQIPGDSTDPQFKAAWLQLAAMSLEKGESMTSILKDREQAWQDELMGRLSTSLTDPARLRINGDAYARDSIGRKLSVEEHAELTKFIHDLERRNAMVNAGLDINATGEEMEGVTPLEEGIVADIDARMAEWIKSDNPDESGAHDVADQYSVFTSLLGGPGRGI